MKLMKILEDIGQGVNYKEYEDTFNDSIGTLPTQAMDEFVYEVYNSLILPNLFKGSGVKITFESVQKILMNIYKKYNIKSSPFIDFLNKSGLSIK